MTKQPVEIAGKYQYRVSGGIIGTSSKNAKQVKVLFKYLGRARSAKLWLKPEWVHGHSDGGYLDLTEEGFAGVETGVRTFITNEEDERNLG